MKTIRLLYPDHVSGGLETYYFGANLLQHILPPNPDQPTIKVDILPPMEKKSRLQTESMLRRKYWRGFKMRRKNYQKRNPTG